MMMKMLKEEKMSVNPNSKEAYSLFHNGILALARAERQGLRIDMDYVTRKKQQLSNKIEDIEDQFRETEFFHRWQKSSSTKVNIHSGLQLGKFIYDELGYDVTKTSKSGKGSVDEEALKQFKIPELDLLLRSSKLKKIRGTYLDGFEREQVDGYLHPFINLHIARSFRSSIDSPNLQNIPIRDKESMAYARGAIFPRPGHQLLEVDFKGIEVAINACINKDKNLINYVSDPTTDMHRDMAIQLLMLDSFDPKIHKTLRQSAKNGFVFPEFYGDWFKSCAENMMCSWGELSPKGKWRKGQGIAVGDSFLSDRCTKSLGG